MAKVSNQSKIYEMINEKICKLLEKGIIPWKKPWITGEPANLITKRPYRGINPLVLNSSGFSCPYWVSFKQVKGKGGKIKKGEQGFPIVFWKWIEIDDEDAKSGKKKVPILRYYTVFNLEQTEGIKIPALDQRAFQPISKAEMILHKMPRPPAIEHEDREAYYVPSRDLVNMPKSSLFESDEEYYSTLFHELTHATGHSSRLNRFELMERHSTEAVDYCKEELVAEIGSAFLCGWCGIVPKVIENQAAYIQGWLKRLKNNQKWLIYAASRAQKAADYILGVDHTKEQSEEVSSKTTVSSNKPH